MGHLAVLHHQQEGDEEQGEEEVRAVQAGGQQRAVPEDPGVEVGEHPLKQVQGDGKIIGDGDESSDREDQGGAHHLEPLPGGAVSIDAQTHGEPLGLGDGVDDEEQGVVKPPDQVAHLDPVPQAGE